MRTRQTMVLKWLTGVLLLVVIFWGVGSVVQAQTIGKTIDKSNVQEYKDLLIPALLRAVERGDFILKTGNLEFIYKQPDSFLAASQKNAEKCDANAEGDIIDKTGKIPKYNIYGLPFPKIDPKDPKAGSKIMWNFNFQKYRQGGTTTHGITVLVNKGGGVDSYRRSHTYYLYYQGRAPGQELKNPEGFITAALYMTVEPMSMRGLNTLSWEFADERDSANFSYVPAIRRIRQSSGASRSDPYMGSDGWMDCSEMWAGKNRTMTWKLVGEKTILVPFVSTAKDVLAEAPDGTMTMTFHDIKWGFRTRGWKGAPWCPTGVTWVPRPVWVVEPWPKDPYYNWGLHINYVDRETYTMMLKEVYDKAGQFRTWNIAPTHFGEGPSGNNNVGHLTGWIAIDEKIRHATESDGVVLPDFIPMKFMPSSKLDLRFFTVTKLLEKSK